MQQVMHYQALREYDKAKAAGQLLLKYFPRDPDASHLYASVLNSTRELTEAIRYYKKALKGKSKDAHCWNDLGAAYIADEQFAKAIDSLEKALKFLPGFPEALMNLGTAYYNVENYSKAIDCINKGLSRRPDIPAAHLLLGNAYQGAMQFDEAIASYKQALTLNPQFYEACINLALILNDTGQLESALGYCSKALELKPGSPVALMLSGQINEHVGKIDAARDAYHQCITLSPDFTAAYWGLANLGQEKISSSVIQTMQSLLERPMPEESRVFLLFALAKAMEQQKDYPVSFDYLQQANQLKRQQLGENIVDVGSLVESLRTQFHEDVISRLRDKGNSQVSPIFIIGMVRSGTSLIEQILASHSEIASGGELETSLQLLLDELPLLTGQDWQASVAQLGPDQLQHLASRYCEINHELVNEKPFFTDKLPFNFAMVGFLSSLFPRARFIHVYKHPLDSCLSCYKQLFTVGQEFSYSLDDLADFYHQYRSMMDHWSALLPDKIFHISYESLVESPRECIENMLEFLSLPWQDDCLQFHKRSGVVKTASAGQVRQGMFKSSVGRWKHYEQYLGPLSDKLQRYDL